MGTALQKTVQQLRSENSEFFQIAISVDCVILVLIRMSSKYY